ncbi:MAG: carboxylating nicotinate-nucleotide diphosphorylase [Planctomycetota bacterium]|nr:carboxylating nicotinate-nucleotide diphosphorylase [Planctomycetota bacterium]
MTDFEPSLKKHLPELRRLVRSTITEDLGSGDLCSELVIPPWARCEAVILAKSPGVVAGLPVARLVFAELDHRVKFMPRAMDGARVRPGRVVARLRGKARSILTGERLALNFLQRLSGIATLTNRFVALARPHGAQILDTRKTTPGLRFLEKYAVRAGGGRNHRMGLHDGAMVKDNHMAILRELCPTRRELVASLATARAAVPANMLFEAEAQSLDDVRALLHARVPVIMLDNMNTRTMSRAVRLVRQADAMRGSRTTIEASGGVCLKNVESMARTGVDWISVGALTHSAPPMDLSLEVVRVMARS